MNTIPQHLQKRLDLLKIDADTRNSLRKVIPVFRDDLDFIVEKFYAHLRQFPEVNRIFTGKAQIDALKKRQKLHWIRLFSCKFDNAYVTGAVKIGKIHYTQNVSPSLYIAGYTYFHCELINAVTKRQSNPRELSTIMTAISRIICLDMDLSLSVYTQENGDKQPSDDESEWVIE
jgi:hemoglobin-like flavoprotein